MEYPTFIEHKQNEGKSLGAIFVKLFIKKSVEKTRLMQKKSAKKTKIRIFCIIP